MIVTLWNYNGGVGKSTISLVLAEIAASNGLHTLAVDLDDQHNLAHQSHRLTLPEYRDSLFYAGRW